MKVMIMLMWETKRHSNVDKKVLVLVGISVFVSMHGVLLATGIPVPPTADSFTTLPGLLYLSAVLGSISFVAAGYGTGIGPVRWRHLAGLGYVLLAVPLAASPTFVNAADQAYGGEYTFVALAGLSTLLLLAMAVDISLDSRVIMTLESGSADSV